MLSPACARARRREQGADAALQSCQSCLDHIPGGVRQARVDGALIFEGEAVSRLLGGLEHVRGGLVDRQRPRPGGGVGLLAGVDLVSFKIPRHEGSL